MNFIAKITFQVLFLLANVFAHSWVEQLGVVDRNGTLLNGSGYARGNVFRTGDFSDSLMFYRLPPDDRGGIPEILTSDFMCKSTQRSRSQTSDSSILRTAPGSSVILWYQENGHVSLPQEPHGKPGDGGTVYIYGTTNPIRAETFLNVHKKWNSDGTGGDMRGKMLTAAKFDDGRCYQVNEGDISTSRQVRFPHKAEPPMGADLWCHNLVSIPSDLQVGTFFTLYWVWDWSTMPHVVAHLPEGKPEIYTTCIDISIIAAER